MALALHAVKALAPHLKGASVLSLGYPDILCTVEEVKEIFGVDPKATIDAGGQHGVHRPLVETKALFEMIGATLDCVDIFQWRGFERVLDLNEPHEIGAFDLVIDPGTSEHCFNVGTAVMNGARAVKPGGRIYHSLPMSMVNHGFYNVCPTALWDFYGQNGWELELYEARNDKLGTSMPEKAVHSRNTKITPESGVICMARRTDDRPLRWPVQHKYLQMRVAK